MEMIIKCPDCGKDLKITVEEMKKKPDTVKLTKKVESVSSWDRIAEEVRTNSGEILAGDEISCTLKDGTEVTFVVAHLNPYDENEVAFVIKDCLPKRSPMNNTATNNGGWRDCYRRKYLRENIYPLLPDDLKRVIKKRTIIQNINGEEFRSEDYIWTPSKTEICGGDNPVDVGDVHFELFCDERSRVKQVEGETDWYSLRSPYTGSGLYFWNVYAGGGSSNYGASNGLGVAFGFLI